MRVSHRSLGVYVPGLREFVPASWTIPENPFTPGMAGLRAFVPARFSLPPQPAGIGDFVGAGAMYPVPLNSVLSASMDSDPSTWPVMGVNINGVSAGPMGMVDPGAPYWGLGQTTNPTPNGQRNISVVNSSTGSQVTVTRGCPRGYYQFQGKCIPIGTAAKAAIAAGASAIQGVSGLGCGGDCGCGGGMSGLGQAATDFGNTFTDLTQGNFSGAWSSFMAFMNDPAFGTVPVWMVAGGSLLVYALFFSGGSHSRYSRGRKAYSAGRSAYA